MENISIIDKWVVPHFIAGILLRKLPLKTFLFIIIVYEIIEYSLEYPKGHWLFGSKRPESLKNVISDLIVASLGRLVGLKYER